MTVRTLKSPSPRSWFTTLSAVSFALSGCLLVSACAESTSPPREVASQTPRVTYQYKGDRELMAANDQAVTYCSQYHGVPHTADIRDTSNGGKEVTFDCLSNTSTVATVPATTVPATTVVPNSGYPYRTDQELLDASRNADAYCISNGSQRAVPTFVTNLDGTKTVTFQCAP